MTIGKDLNSTTILYVDDEKQNLDSFKFVFRHNYNISLSDSPFEALEIIKNTEIPVVISDQRMPGVSGVDFIKKAKEISPDTIFILLTAYADIDVIIKAVNKLHIFQFIQKPWREEILKKAIDSALEEYRKNFTRRQPSNPQEGAQKTIENSNQSNELQKDEFREEENNYHPDFTQIVTRNKKVKSILRNLERISVSDAPVLIQGETGTGKELIAHAIHNLSKRSKGEMIKVNCPAIPESLFESEIFGHEKGAFTGALKRKIGRIEQANGGTLFLDEIGELPMHIQPKLLRAIQQQEFERIGGEKTIKANVRIVAATNRNLLESIERNDFRQDLFYRLNVFPVHIPPLRERVDDIKLLTEYFINKFSKQYNKRIKSLSNHSLRNLIDYSWPGNIRELENIIERSVLLSNEPVLYIENLNTKTNLREELTGPVSLEEIIRRHILNILKSTNWKIYGENGAAKLLNVKPTTLQSKMLKLGIQKP